MKVRQQSKLLLQDSRTSRVNSTEERRRKILIKIKKIKDILSKYAIKTRNVWKIIMRKKEILDIPKN